jgi:transposase
MLWSLWCACMQSLFVLFEGTDTICRQLNHVYNVQENREAQNMLNVVCNPFLECKKRETGWHSSSTLWVVWRISHASMVRSWVRHFNDGCKNVHDDPPNGWPSVVNEDLVRAVEEKIQEKRRFTNSSLSLHFPQNFTVISSQNCVW